MIRTALVGFGASATNIHLPLIQNQSDLDIVAVLSSNPQKVATVLGDVPCFSDYQEFLSNSDAQLLIITTPNHLHYTMAMDALSAGKHLVVEKPVAVATSDITSLKTTAEQHNRQLFPFHNRRWDGDFLTVKKLLDENHLGDIKLFESRFDRFRPTVSPKWKEQTGQQTGLWFDLGPHLLDQTIELFGLPVAITARLLNTRPEAGVTDYFNVQLHYANHEVVLSASNHCAGPVRRFYIEGSQGSFNLAGVDPQEAQMAKGIQPGSPQFGLSNKFPTGQLYTASGCAAIARCQGNWPGYYQAVADCLLRGDTFPVSLDSAFQVAKFLHLAELSQEQNKTIWVRQYRD